MCPDRNITKDPRNESVRSERRGAQEHALQGWTDNFLAGFMQGVYVGFARPIGKSCSGNLRILDQNIDPDIVADPVCRPEED